MREYHLSNFIVTLLSIIDDLGFIDKLLDSLLANYSIDANKIYICGFSNGGFMTQRFACQQNQRFAAMASLGSIMDTSLFANCNPQRAIPMMFVLGTDDPFVPFNGGTMQGSGLTTEIVSGDTLVNFWRINNNCIQSSPPLDLPDIVQSDSSTVTLFNYSICSCNSDVKFYRINGGGHTWPGVEIPLYEVIAGQTNEDIQASVEMWNFFNAHSLCNSGVGVTENETINSTTFYPNPTSDILFINQVNNNFIQYQITNSTCKLLLQDSFIDNGINISNLTNGFYFIRFTNDKNETAYYKFVKQ